MNGNGRSVRLFWAAAVVLASLFLQLPIPAVGEEEANCTPPTLPEQYPVTTYPVEGTSMVITEGRLSFEGTSTTNDYHRNPTIAMDTVQDAYGVGRLLVAWDGRVIGSNCGLSAIYGIQLNSDGTSLCAPVFLSPPTATTTSYNVGAEQPSAALTPSGAAYVAWMRGVGSIAQSLRLELLGGRTFSLSDLCSLGTTLPSAPTTGLNEHEASVGIGSQSTVAAWSRAADPGGADPYGLLYVVTDAEQIRGCDETCNPSNCPGIDVCWYGEWQICSAMRSDAKYVLCWSDLDTDDDFGHFYFDIRLQAYASNGAKIGNEVTINSSISAGPTIEESPAVAIDAPDGNGVSNIVVVWVGQHPDGCMNRFRIYGRRLIWNPNSLTPTPEFVGEQFMIDADPTLRPTGGTTANPALALSSDPNHRGRWVAAWNVYSGDPPISIHAQFFEADGKPLGREFRVNQEQNSDSRGLANSAAHTIAYHETVGFAWHRGTIDGSGVNPLDVHFTLLPAGYADHLESNLSGCRKGDVDGNGLVNGRDVQAFVNLLFNGPACFNILQICAGDLDEDGAVTTDDIPDFVDAVLDPPPGSPPPVIEDCNSNQVPDDEDIASQTSNDVNTNGVPDECDWDCNSNGVPDDWDIAQATSADCNSDGWPDECEADCNSNGVPDDCDVDPTDPDGDGFVCADCNSNGYPDECDLALPPGFGSLDCNTNGIPDECDIAACENDPACGDCNENGIPDSCDIAAEISEDANTNGIPDECEGEGMMGEGESTAEGGYATQEGGEFNEEAAWEAFYDWAATQCWGPACETTGAEQFAAIVAKLKELGLPVTGRANTP